MGPRKCYICDSEDHIRDDRPQMLECENVDPKIGKKKTMHTCFNCGAKGHISAKYAYRLAPWRMGKNVKAFYIPLSRAVTGSNLG